MNEAIAALLGAIIGGLISFIGQWLLWKQEKRDEKKAIASAVAAEIDGYLNLMERRKHASSAQKKIEKLEKGQDVSFGNLITHYEINNEPFPVIRSITNRIGVLDKDAADVAKFYNLIYGIRTTIIAFKEGDFDNTPLHNKANIARGEIEIWSEAYNLGRELVERLRAYH